LSDILPHAIQRRTGYVLGPSDEQAKLAFRDAEAFSASFIQKLGSRALESACAAL
jgi:hypothetical protein